MAPQSLQETGEAQAFAEAWNEFFGSVRRARGRAAREARPGTLTLAQFGLLSALADTPELTVGELALAAGVAPPTATRMLGGLERDGIVTRTASKEDRRRVLVALTDGGLELVQAKRSRVAAKQAQIFSMLSAGERKQAERILRRLSAAVEEL